MFIAYNYILISIPIIEKLNLKSEKIEKEIKITQISDFHNNKYLKSKRLIKGIDEFNPHMILLTGDIIDRSTEDWNISLELLKKLKNICPDIYFVSGNHEMNNRKYLHFLKDLESIGIEIMDNRIEDLEINSNRLKLIGVDYYFKQYDYKSMMKDVQNESFNLLLSHSPDRIVPSLTGEEDLVLSGHTHGGQVRIPFVGALIAPGQGFFPKYDKGLYHIGKTDLYVDSGLGNSMLPIRLFNRAQITNITIN